MEFLAVYQLDNLENWFLEKIVYFFISLLTSLVRCGNIRITGNKLSGLER